MKKPQSKDRKPAKKDEWHPSVEGNFMFKNLEKNAMYILSVNEYNDLGKKCKLVGGFYNPRDLKDAPGVKKFIADRNGKYEKPFKNLPLGISGRDSIINRSCVLKRIKGDDSDSDSEDEKKKKKKHYTKCALVNWEAPYWAGSASHTKNE